MTTLVFPGVEAESMVKQRPLDSHSPAPTAVRASIATDARILHADLGIPLVDAVRVVVHDSDHVAPEDRAATVAAVLAHLD
jgi:hypothetical protein